MPCKPQSIHDTKFYCALQSSVHECHIDIKHVAILFCLRMTIVFVSNLSITHLTLLLPGS